MDRRKFLKSAGLFSLAALEPSLFAATSKKSKPNILFIAVDDLNDWVGAFGVHPSAKTPNIDRLAARGIRFSHAYCAAPLCNPSRSALMSGMRPSTTGIYENRHVMEKYLPDPLTLEYFFKQHGYYVAGGGKIFHGGLKYPDHWDVYAPKYKTPSPKKSNRRIIRQPFGFGPIDADENEMRDMKLAAWACDQLALKHNKPLFLAVGFKKPHLAWFVPRKYFDMHPLSEVELLPIREDDLTDVPPVGKKFAIDGVGFNAPKGGDHKMIMERGLRKRATQAYLAACSFADACVGKVLDALEKSPYAENTIIVLWGDHGWHLGEKLHWRKHALWEEATRNPLIMSVPGVTRPGSVCSRTVSLLDLYPTLVDLCGFEKPDFLEGTSLLPLLRNPKAKWERPVVTTYGENNHAVRSERWRYIRYFDGTEELYDHDNDPIEWTNLAAKPEFAKVKEKLARWLPSVNKPDTLKSSRLRQMEEEMKVK